MKKIKSLLCVFLCALALCVLGGCKNNKTVVTIIQYVSATALDNACEGIKQGLKEAGFVEGENIKLNVYNPQAKADTLSQYAEKALEESDIIFAIATPVALELVEQSKKLGYTGVHYIFAEMDKGSEVARFYASKGLRKLELDEDVHFGIHPAIKLIIAFTFLVLILTSFVLISLGV